MGFVVFEGMTRVMDWGTRMAVDWRDRKRMVARNAICRLLDFYHPPMVVVHRHGTSPNALHIAAIIQAEAKRRSGRCHTLPSGEIARFYAAHGCTTKHSIALLIAERFPELSWEIPPRRKPWQSESRHTLIFDAAAVGLVFLVAKAQETA